MNLLDFIYSIATGVFGGFVVICSQVSQNAVKNKKGFWKLIFPAVVTALFLEIIIFISILIF